MLKNIDLVTDCRKTSRNLLLFQDDYISEALITSILLTDQKRHFSMLTNLEQKPARLLLIFRLMESNRKRDKVPTNVKYAKYLSLP